MDTARKRSKKEEESKRGYSLEILKRNENKIQMEDEDDNVKGGAGKGQRQRRERSEKKIKQGTRKGRRSGGKGKKRQNVVERVSEKKQRIEEGRRRN